MAGNVKGYRGFQVMILVPTTVEQVSALRNIEENMTGCGLDWLTEGPVSQPNISGERFILDVSGCEDTSFGNTSNVKIPPIKGTSLHVVIPTIYPPAAGS